MLSIKFGLWIYDHEKTNHNHVEGPIFTRWLPDGENDAISIDITEHHANVLLWFERHGFVNENGYIEYKHKINEIDPDIIPKQKKILAGALYGKVILQQVTEEQIAVLTSSDYSNAEYIKLGKLVVKKILDPILYQFTRLLRDTYGQYWIAIYRKFDSRSQSLANHCESLFMEWSLGDETTGSFLPGEKTTKVISIELFMSTCSEEEYIDKNSWLHIEQLLRNNFEPSVSSTVASRANKLLEEERFSHALLEAVTGLELALEEYVRRSISSHPGLEKHMRSFWETPLPTRVSVVASLAGVNLNDISNSIAGISERNKFAHDGIEPDKSVSSHIKGILKTISLLNNHQNLKFPRTDASNKIDK